MKKLLALLPFSVALAACATGQTYTNSAAQPTERAYDRMAADQFMCEDDATVAAKYSTDGEQAQLTASLPRANWNNQTLVMDIAPSGSGARYVNNDSANVSYDWQTKADIGIMTLRWADGNEYSVNCERR